MVIFDRDEDVRNAITLVENANLQHPQGPLLACFVREATNPKVAAQYLLSKCDKEDKSNAGLQALTSDWTFVVDSISKDGTLPHIPTKGQISSIRKRDGDKCCITGENGKLFDPLTVVPISRIPTLWVKQEKRVLRILEAFFGGQYCDWWLDQAEKPDLVSPFKNHWLVRKSAAQAMIQGRVVLNRLPNSMTKFEVESTSIGDLQPSIIKEARIVNLEDQSNMDIEKIDARFIGTQARFSTSLRMLDISRQIAANKARRLKYRAPPAQRSTFTGVLTAACLTVWLCFPTTVRIAAYKMLRNLGSSIYGANTDGAPVQRLPFGMYLKYNRARAEFQNEYDALKTVRKHTTIPVPQPLDIVAETVIDEDGESQEDGYLLTTRISGYPLSRCYMLMSDEELSEYKTDMQSYMAQLRTIPKRMSPSFAICGASGGPCRDTRIGDARPVGPFAEESDFSNLLRYSDDEARKGHKIYFTHADLNPRNVLLDQSHDGSWRISGIVDWENAGYYPEYWDYTKSLFEGFRWPKRITDTLHAVWAPFGYEKEFEIENRSWEEGDAI